jgi:5-methylcytosine-specific restriction endonuclease McrA
MDGGDDMSRDKNYQRLLNSPRWRKVKTQVWRRANGLCERCIREGKAAGVPDGYITPGVDCHHIKPVESGRTVMEMEQLCYNPANIELLCIPCHIKTHQEMRSHTLEKVQANKQRARQRFMEANDPNWQPGDPTPKD